MAQRSDVLADIIAHKKTEIAAAIAARPLSDVKSRAAMAPPARSFFEALNAKEHNSSRIIAECKRMSPSRGIMVSNYDPVALARAYQSGGAAAISVLTDAKFFGGALAHMTAVRAAVGIPVLRKDFIIDEYQVYEARAANADTFLLLSGVLTTAQLEHLIGIGRSLGMEPLIESHTDEELAAALATSGRIFGVNNRDLKTFAIDLQTSRDLLVAAKASSKASKTMSARLFVCESGIKSRADIEAMERVGYRAFLVGESVATHADPEAAVRALVG